MSRYFLNAGIHLEQCLEICDIGCYNIFIPRNNSEWRIRKDASEFVSVIDAGIM